MIIIDRIGMYSKKQKANGLKFNVNAIEDKYSLKQVIGRGDKSWVFRCLSQEDKKKREFAAKIVYYGQDYEIEDVKQEACILQ